MNDCTFNQRRAILNMSMALGIRPVEGYRNFTKERASEEIEHLKRIIMVQGFPKKEKERKEE